MPAFMELLPFIVDLGDNKDLFKIPFAAIGENLGIICGSLIVGISISYFMQGLTNFKTFFNHFFCKEMAAKASQIMTPIGYLYVICCAVISLVKVKIFNHYKKKIFIL